MPWLDEIRERADKATKGIDGLSWYNETHIIPKAVYDLSENAVRDIPKLLAYIDKLHEGMAIKDDFVNSKRRECLRSENECAPRHVNGCFECIRKWAEEEQNDCGREDTTNPRQGQK